MRKLYLSQKNPSYTNRQLKATQEEISEKKSLTYKIIYMFRANITKRRGPLGLVETNRVLTHLGRGLLSFLVHDKKQMNQTPRRYQCTEVLIPWL